MNARQVGYHGVIVNGIRFLIMATSLIMAGTVLADSPKRVVNSTVPAGQQPGRMPYEMRWADRQPPQAQVVFADLNGWTLDITQGDADVGLEASVAQRIWQPQVARFSYGGGQNRTTAIIKPPQPITIPDRFDAARMWVFGGYYRRATEDVNPPNITLLLQDREGRPVRIGLGDITSGTWSLEQGVVPPESLNPSCFPMQFTGIEVDQVDHSTGASDMFFESIEFYQQHRSPSAHVFKQLNDIFPTSEDGWLPTPPQDVQTSLEPSRPGATFVSQANGNTLRFRVNPKEGFLNGIEAQWNDEPWFRPAATGGIKLNVDGHKADVVDQAQVISSLVKGETLVTQWKSTELAKPVEWTATYSIRGRTLVVDIASSGGHVAAIDAGQVEGLAGARGVFVPYMAMNRITHLTTEGPLIACGDKAFVSVFPDVYNSDFSNLANDPSKEWNPGDGKLRLITGTQYEPLTDGKRNDLRDRFLITVSNEFDEILPNARNPVSPYREKLAPYLHFMAYLTHEEMFKGTHRYGMDKVVANHHVFAHFVGDGYERLASFAYRWRPRDDTKISQWQAYSKAIKDLGYLYGVYTYFPDLSPLSEYWDENRVALDQDGGLRRGWWYGYFFVKLNDAARLGGEVAELIKQVHNADCTYLDIHTVIGPIPTDYEAGVEGAGTARGTVLANTDVIAETRKRIGPVFGEGYHRWLYTGVGDVDYATLLHPSRYGSASGAPLLVDFDLRKIAPFGHGTMMGFEPKYFLGESSKETEAVYRNDTSISPPEGWYKYISASLGYGHMAALGYDYLPSLNRMIQLYALMQGVQSEYLTDVATSIQYHDGKQFLPTSEALRKDIVGNGRLRVEYSKGLVVQVNYNGTENWTVDAAGRTFELPPYGWVIEKPGEILAYSALHDGHRVDVVKCPSYIYVNSGEHPFTDSELGLEVTGAIWLKWEGETWRAIPCGDLGPWDKFYSEKWPDDLYDFRLSAIPENRGLSHCLIDTQKVFGKPAAAVQVTARDAGGKTVESSSVKVDGDRLRIVPQQQVVDYLLE